MPPPPQVPQYPLQNLVQDPPRPPSSSYQPVYLPAPPPETEWPIPKLVFSCDDLAHPGAILFFEEVKPTTALRAAVISVFEELYTPATAPRVQEIRVILRPMDGVAYTTGSATHKEIHFSLDHLSRCKDRAGDEACGVLTHEMVHCFQHNGAGRAPGGLIEGIAEWVRLRAKLAPPYWTRKPREKWDAGYEATGYFLAWIEGRWGNGTIAELNARLAVPYNEHVFKDLTRHHVDSLWRLYREHRAQNPEGNA